MLVLSRKIDESIMIGSDIKITVVDIRGDKIRIGIEAPKELSVHREEVYKEIVRQALPGSRPPLQKAPSITSDGSPLPSQGLGSSPGGKGVVCVPKYESFGPITNPDGSCGITTKDFLRANPKWCYAEIKLPKHLTFPHDMFRYDSCEVNPGYEPVIDGGTACERFILVRRPHTSPKKWSVDRWHSFGCQIEVISGEIRTLKK